jgi:RNA recognition motif-containing protein
MNSKKKEQRVTLFVGGLAFCVTEKQLEGYFSQFSPVFKVILLRDRTTGISKGYAFVTIQDGPGAQQITTQKNMIAGRRVECENASKKCEKVYSNQERKRRKLYVSRIPPKLSDQQLESFFSKFGKLRNCYIIKDMNSNTNKPFGYVEFETSDSAEMVLSMRGELKINGWKIAVHNFKDKMEQKEKKAPDQMIKLAKEKVEVQQPEHHQVLPIPQLQPPTITILKEDSHLKPLLPVIPEIPEKNSNLLPLPLNSISQMKPVFNYLPCAETPCSNLSRNHTNGTFSTQDTPTAGLFSPMHSPFHQLHTPKFSKVSTPSKSGFVRLAAFRNKQSTLENILDIEEFHSKKKISHQNCDSSFANYCFKVAMPTHSGVHGIEPLHIRENYSYDEQHGIFVKRNLGEFDTPQVNSHASGHNQLRIDDSQENNQEADRNQREFENQNELGLFQQTTSFERPDSTIPREHNFHQFQQSKAPEYRFKLNTPKLFICPPEPQRVLAALSDDDCIH